MALIIDTYSAMGKFSIQQIGDIFLIFPRKQDLTLSNPVSWEK